MSTRRGFLGALLSGGAGALAMGTGVKLNGSILVPADMEETVKSAGELVLVKPGDTRATNMVAANTVVSNSVWSSQTTAEESWNMMGWFGVGWGVLGQMEKPVFEQWLHDHLELNRQYGVDKTIRKEIESKRLSSLSSSLL